MRRWIIRHILVPWLRERALVLPSEKRKELAGRLGIDEREVAAIEQLIRDAVIEALTKE